MKILYALLANNANFPTKESAFMANIDTKHATEKWEATQSTVSKWCRNNLILGTTQDKRESTWHISKNAKSPMNKRK